MDSALSSLEALRKEIGDRVDSRLEAFRELGKRDSRELFKELCFCILTANYTAEGGIRIQEAIGDGFLDLPEQALAERLKALGHRFPNTRARYITGARKYRDELGGMVRFLPENRMRDWLVRNVKGLGLKEASHFLRNIGCLDLAIIDFHIIDFLVGAGLAERPRTLTRKRYLEMEQILKEMASRLEMSLAELDLYIWYQETGKILK